MKDSKCIWESARTSLEPIQSQVATFFESEIDVNEDAIGNHASLDSQELHSSIALQGCSMSIVSTAIQTHTWTVTLVAPTILSTSVSGNSFAVFQYLSLSSEHYTVNSHTTATRQSQPRAILGCWRFLSHGTISALSTRGYGKEQCERKVAGTVKIKENTITELAWEAEVRFAVCTYMWRFLVDVGVTMPMEGAEVEEEQKDDLALLSSVLLPCEVISTLRC